MPRPSIHPETKELLLGEGTPELNGFARECDCDYHDGQHGCLHGNRRVMRWLRLKLEQFEAERDR